MIGGNLAFGMGWWGANQSDFSKDISISLGMVWGIKTGIGFENGSGIGLGND